MTVRLVKGHTLLHEGRAYKDDGTPEWYSWKGRGRCSCGEMSDVLDSKNARKRWHRQHKADIASDDPSAP